jgi:integration host factor subunit beta
MSGKMTKAELIEVLHAGCPFSRKDIHTLIDAFLEQIKVGMLSGKTIELRGFGTFEIRMRKGRKRARNPKTGEIVSVEDHGVACFRPGREMKKDAWDFNQVVTKQEDASE